MWTMLCQPLTSKAMRLLPSTPLPEPKDESAMKPTIPTSSSVAPKTRE